MSSAVKLFGLLTGDRFRILGLLGLMFVGALLEALGIAAIFPFMAVISDQNAVTRYQLPRQLFQLSGLQSTHTFLLWVGVGLIIAYLLKAAYLIYLSHVQHSFFARSQIAISRRLMSGYLTRPYTYHLLRNSADMQRVLNSDVQVVFNSVVSPVFRMIIEGMVVAAIATVLLIIEPAASLLAIALLSTVALVFSRVSRKQIAVSGAAQTERFGEMIRWVNQALGSVKETKVLGRESFFVEAYTRTSLQFARAARTFGMASELPRLTIETLTVVAVLGTVVIMLFGRSDLQRAIPTLGLFAMSAVRLMPSLSRISAGAAALRFFHASIEAVDRDLREVETPVTGRFTASLPKLEHASIDSPALKFETVIEVRGVSYRYPGAENQVLRDISLTIPKGHHVAFAGLSGAGKTTLVDIILGVLTPIAGQVSVDGIDIQRNLRAWQSLVGYIPQATYLLDDTIRRNVAFGIPDEQIDDSQVARALEVAQLGPFVENLGNKLDSNVGEHGVRLSGGQRQRLGVARALYHDPLVLVLDEATSAVDRQTEREILDAIGSLGPRLTTITVSHRLYTLKECDSIFFIKEGQVRSAGSYGALVSADPEFRKLEQTGARSFVDELAPVGDDVAKPKNPR